MLQEFCITKVSFGMLADRILVIQIGHLELHKDNTVTFFGISYKEILYQECMQPNRP